MTMIALAHCLELNGSSNRKEETGEVCIANNTPL
jgi:hypothetical protein